MDEEKGKESIVYNTKEERKEGREKEKAREI